MTSSSQHKTVEVAVSKEHRDDPVGLMLLQDNDGAIVVQKIASSSLFQNTELRVGMKVVEINDVSTKGMSLGQALKLLRDAEDVIIIEACTSKAKKKESVVLDVDEFEESFRASSTDSLPKFEESFRASSTDSMPKFEEEGSLLKIPPPNHNLDVDQLSDSFHGRVHFEDTADAPSTRAERTREPERQQEPEAARESYTDNEPELVRETMPKREPPAEPPAAASTTYYMPEPQTQNHNNQRSYLDPDEIEDEDPEYRTGEATVIMLPEDRIPSAKPDPDGRRGPPPSMEEIPKLERQAVESVIWAEEDLQKYDEQPRQQPEVVQKRQSVDPSVIMAAPMVGAAEASVATAESAYEEDEGPYEQEEEEDDDEFEEETRTSEPSSIYPTQGVRSAASLSTTPVNNITRAKSDTPDNVRVTAHKSTSDSPVGLGLRKHPEGDGIMVDNVKPHSIFRNTALRPGMTILTINGVDCHKNHFTVEQAVHLLRKSIGSITVVATTAVVRSSSVSSDLLSTGAAGKNKATTTTTMATAMATTAATGASRAAPAPAFIPTKFGPVVATVVTKPTPNASLGLSLADRTENDKTVPVIIDIEPNGLCSRTPLQKDMRILCINGVACHTRDEAIALLKRSTETTVAIVAGPAHATTAITIIKPSPHARVGVSMRYAEGIGLLVDSISPAGLLAKQTELKQGMRILIINGTSTEHLQSDQVLAIIRNAPDMVTIVAALTNVQMPSQRVSGIQPTSTIEKIEVTGVADTAPQQQQAQPQQPEHQLPQQQSQRKEQAQQQEVVDTCCCFGRK